MKTYFQIYKNDNILTCSMVVLISIYLFFSDTLSAFELYTVKIAVMLGIVVAYLCWFASCLMKWEIQVPRVVVFFGLLIPFYLLVWNDLSEINLILTPFLGYMLYKNEKIFIKILKVIIVVQFFALLYEFMTSSYIFTNITVGGIINKTCISDYSKTAQLFTDMGFRPKGLFAGTLVASTFAIASAVLLRKNIKWLFLLTTMSLISNGRLAILLVSIILIASLVRYALRRFHKNKMIVAVFVTSIVGLIFCVFFMVQSQKAIDNLCNIFDTQSSANFWRLRSMKIGASEYYSYPIIHKIFGNPGHIYKVHKTGAESEWLSHLLNIGLVGTLLYLVSILIVFFKSYKMKLFDIALTSFLVFFALCVCRHTAGFMRGALFWFYIFTAMKCIRMAQQKKAGHLG